MHELRALTSFSRTSVLLSLLCATALCVVAGQAKKNPPAQPLNLNTATLEQLQMLPEIGPTRAKAIVRFREKSGPFRRVEDLLAVPGISKRRLEKIRPFVVVEPQAKGKTGMRTPFSASASPRRAESE